jgi:hypothetical protein
MELKIILLGALINTALTIVLSLIFLPLLFLGPITGGFIAAYFSKGYEYYDKMDKKDGAVVGSVVGIIGGLIIGLLSIIGIGDINTIIGLISNNIGSIGNNYLIIGYIIIQLSVIISLVLGLIGGVIGVIAQK